MSHVMVAYASRYGSTAEVAQRIGECLKAGGADVEVRPVGEVRSLDGSDAVVLAAPFYVGSLLKEANQFLERHKDALSSRPVALATLGPLSAEDDMAEARQQLDRLLEKTPWLKPVAAEMFVGKWDPDGVRGCDRLLKALPASPLHGRAAADDRDWDAIESWSEKLPTALKS